jgi:prevent-host-death family protein
MSKAPRSPGPVEVGVRELRDHLSAWLERIKAGEEIVITERGRPVARISRVTGRERLDELIALGVVTPAQRPRRPAESFTKVKMSPGPPIEDIIADMRR